MRVTEQCLVDDADFFCDENSIKSLLSDKGGCNGWMPPPPNQATNYGADDAVGCLT